MADRNTHPGTVCLVGAGPGDPELLTVRARRLIDSADVVLHDSLVHDGVLSSCPSGATLVDVGKRPGPNGERTTQAEIHELLVEYATAGQAVVRLKCGDPMVFARGGEEAEFLADAGIDFEIVPGVTSAIAAPGAAGIPVTHRDHASMLTVVTGHEDPTKTESAIDWNALADIADAGGTLAILMGVGKLPENTAALEANGLDPETPVAMVERATYHDEQVVTGTLDTICERAKRTDISPPAVTLVGEVVAVRDAVDDCLVSLAGQLPAPRHQRAEAD